MKNSLFASIFLLIIIFWSFGFMVGVFLLEMAGVVPQ